MSFFLKPPCAGGDWLQREGGGEECIFMEERELSPELLNVRLEAAAFLPHSQLSVRARDWAAAEEITHPAFIVSSPLQNSPHFFWRTWGAWCWSWARRAFPRLSACQWKPGVVWRKRTRRARAEECRNAWRRRKKRKFSEEQRDEEPEAKANMSLPNNCVFLAPSVQDRYFKVRNGNICGSPCAVNRPIDIVQKRKR